MLTDSTVLFSFVENEKNNDPTRKEERNGHNEPRINIIMDITRYSSFFKTIRVTAFILRCVANCKIPKSQ